MPTPTSTLQQQFVLGLHVMNEWGYSFEESPLHADGHIDDMQLASMLQKAHPETGRLLKDRIAEEQQQASAVVDVIPEFFAACQRVATSDFFSDFSLNLEEEKKSESFTVVSYRDRQEHGAKVSNGLFAFLRDHYPEEISKRQRNQEPFFVRRLSFADLELENPHISVDNAFANDKNANPLYNAAHYTVDYQGKKYRIYYDTTGNESFAFVTDEASQRYRLDEEELKALRDVLHLNEARAELTQLIQEKEKAVDTYINRVSIVTAMAAMDVNLINEAYLEDIVHQSQKAAEYALPSSDPRVSQLQDRISEARRQWDQGLPATSVTRQTAIEDRASLGIGGKAKKSKKKSKKPVEPANPVSSAEVFLNNERLGEQHRAYLALLNTRPASIENFLQIQKIREKLLDVLTIGYIQLRQEELPHLNIKAALEEMHQYHPLVDYLLDIDRAELTMWIANDNSTFLNFFQQVTDQFYLSTLKNNVKGQETSEHDRQLIILIALSYQSSDTVKAMIQRWHNCFFHFKHTINSGTTIGDLHAYLLIYDIVPEYIAFSIEQGLFPVNQLALIHNSKRYTHAQLACQLFHEHSEDLVQKLADAGHDFFVDPVIPDRLLANQEDFDWFRLIISHFSGDSSISASKAFCNHKKIIELIYVTSKPDYFIHRIGLTSLQRLENVDEIARHFARLSIEDQLTQFVIYLTMIDWYPTFNFSAQDHENPIGYQLDHQIRSGEGNQFLYFQPVAEPESIDYRRYRITGLIRLNKVFPSLNEYLKNCKDLLPALIEKLDAKIKKISIDISYESPDLYSYCLHVSKLILICYGQLSWQSDLDNPELAQQHIARSAILMDVLMVSSIRTNILPSKASIVFLQNISNYYLSIYHHCSRDLQLSISYDLVECLKAINILKARDDALPVRDPEVRKFLDGLDELIRKALEDSKMPNPQLSGGGSVVPSDDTSLYPSPLR